MNQYGHTVCGQPYVGLEVAAPSEGVGKGSKGVLRGAAVQAATVGEGEGHSQVDQSAAGLGGRAAVRSVSASMGPVLIEPPGETRGASRPVSTS